MSVSSTPQSTINNIGDILGQNFREFVKVVESKAYKTIVASDLLDRTNKDVKDNDVPSEVTETVASITNAFNVIDPTIATSMKAQPGVSAQPVVSAQQQQAAPLASVSGVAGPQSQGQSASVPNAAAAAAMGAKGPAGQNGSLYQMLAEAGGEEQFDFNSLPLLYEPQSYKERTGQGIGQGIKHQIDHLVPGFNTFPYYESIYPKRIQEDSTPFVNVIKYLYHFIALLNLEKLTGGRVIAFLIENDNINFNKYVREIYTASRMQNNNLSGFYNGLSDIAEIIIESFKAQDSNIPRKDYKTIVGDMDLRDEKIVLERILPKDFPKQGDKVGDIQADKKQLYFWVINGLYNPEYLDLAKISADIKDGGNSGQDVNTSLRYLYGFPIQKQDEGETRNLITQSKQGTTNGNQIENAEIISPSAVTEMNGVISSLINIKNYYKNLPNDDSLTSNAVRVSVFRHITNYISKKITGSELNVAPGSGNELTEMVDNYQKIHNRLETIPGADDIKANQQFSDAFNGVVTATFQTSSSSSSSSSSTSGKQEALPGTVGGSRNNSRNNSKDNSRNNNRRQSGGGIDLNYEPIKKFYFDHIQPNVSFYERFFELARQDRGGFYAMPLGAITTTDRRVDLSGFVLNVRRVDPINFLSLGQQGAQPQDPAFTHYLGFVPDDGSVGKIWTSTTTSIDPKPKMDPKLKAVILAKLVLEENVQSPAAAKQLRFNYPELFKSLSRKPFQQQVPVTTMWKEHESRLSEHILKVASQWERDGDIFVKRDQFGNVIDQQMEDSCSLINLANGPQQCFDFLSTCASSVTDNPTDCRKLLEFEFLTKDPPLNALKDTVIKIDPSIAFNVLRKFRFASNLVEEPRYPIPGFKRFKVQSVESWLKELFEGTDRCKGPGVPRDPCDPRPLSEQLGEEMTKLLRYMAGNSKYAPFFNYLNILVEWVNANPQVLNKEEAKEGFQFYHRYPDVNKNFNIYDYQNPYKPADVRIRTMVCGLERLKTSILNELTGVSGATIISNIANNPLDIQNPLNRNMFPTAIPVASVIAQARMAGGGIEDELSGVNYQYGYALFYNIYKYLIETMDTMANPRRPAQQQPTIVVQVTPQQIQQQSQAQQTQATLPFRLAGKTRDGIEVKLENFKVAEDELRDSLIKLVRRNQLYQASRGHINAYNIPDENLAAVLAKHSNLLGLSRAYNNKALNLIEIFQTINRAILSKLQEAEGRPSQYPSRPMSMEYPPLPYGAKK